MKTAFRQVALATTLEAESAVGELLYAVFGIAPSVFTHPELRVSVVSVYLDEKKSITDDQRQAVSEGMAWIAECGLTVGDWKLEVKRLRREDWVDSWKRHFQPIRTQLRHWPTRDHEILPASTRRPSQTRRAKLA
jgi:hypothetical protein